MAQQPAFPLSWGLPYHHHAREAGGAGGGGHLQTAHTHAALAQTALEHAQCKGEGEEYREYGALRCGGGGGYGGGGDKGPDAALAAEHEERVSSTAGLGGAPWGERTVSSSLCAGAPPPAPPSPPHHVTTTHAGGSGGGGRRGALQLWQFLVSLLAEGARCVAWTGRGLEFKLHEPEEVGGAAVGRTEESAGHELRQAVALAAVLLREGHHAEGRRRAVRVQVRVRPRGAVQHGGAALAPRARARAPPRPAVALAPVRRRRLPALPPPAPAGLPRAPLLRPALSLRHSHIKQRSS